MATVVVVTYMSGPHDGETVRLTASGSPPAITFGRLDSCTIQIEDDPDVSRTHAKMYWNTGRWWLQDLGSLNGTYLGEFLQSVKASTPLAVAPGQIFRIGTTRLRLEEAGSAVTEDRREAQAAELDQ
jgi:pSer/pThr/pTyr-binding forkhead associated (FHA) protein